MIKLARPLIRRFGLGAEIGPEDVANDALLEICKEAGSGKLPRFESRDGFWSYVRCLMTQISSNARRGGRSLKRGGPGRNPRSTRTDYAPRVLHRVDLDANAIPYARPIADDIVLGSAEVEAYLEALDREGLGETVRMLEDGFTLEEIAQAQGWGVWTVKRRLYRARELWIKWEGRC